MQSIPALGVMEWTMVGFSFRKTRTRDESARMSLITAICLSMGTAIVRTPSADATRTNSASGDERAITSYWADSSRSIPEQNAVSDEGTVVARISLMLFLIAP